MGAFLLRRPPPESALAKPRCRAGPLRVLEKSEALELGLVLARLSRRAAEGSRDATRFFRGSFSYQRVCSANRGSALTPRLGAANSIR